MPLNDAYEAFIDFSSAFYFNLGILKELNAMMTCFNTFKLLDRTHYQEKIARTFPVFTDSVIAVGIAVAIIGLLALASLHYPHVNVLGNFAIIGRPWAIGMIAGGSALASFAIALNFFINRDEIKNAVRANKVIDNCSEEITNAVDANKLVDNLLDEMTSVGHNLCYDEGHQSAFYHRIGCRFDKETIVCMEDRDTKEDLYFVHVIPSSNGLECFFSPNMFANLAPSVQYCLLQTKNHKCHTPISNTNPNQVIVVKVVKKEERLERTLITAEMRTDS